jgi:ribonuclease HI
MNRDIRIQMFTDGACKGNPGIGGWGVFIILNDETIELKGYSELTTNNKMELTAVIKGLESIKNKVLIEIITDSQYVKNGINEWIINWKNNGWKTASKKNVKNKELWQELDQMVKNFDIKWKWVRGHSGHFGNERADQLANEAIDEFQNGYSK